MIKARIRARSNAKKTSISIFSSLSAYPLEGVGFLSLVELCDRLISKVFFDENYIYLTLLASNFSRVVSFVLFIALVRTCNCVGHHTISRVFLQPTLKIWHNVTFSWLEIVWESTTICWKNWHNVTFSFKNDQQKIHKNVRRILHCFSQAKMTLVCWSMLIGVLLLCLTRLEVKGSIDAWKTNSIDQIFVGPQECQENVQLWGNFWHNGTFSWQMADTIYTKIYVVGTECTIVQDFFMFHTIFQIALLVEPLNETAIFFAQMARHPSSNTMR